jgi:uncharacterized protein YqcC (DUF446 family)
MKKIIQVLLVLGIFSVSFANAQDWSTSRSHTETFKAENHGWVASTVKRNTYFQPIILPRINIVPQIHVVPRVNSYGSYSENREFKFRYLEPRRYR